MRHIIQQDQPLLEALIQMFPQSSKTTLRSWLKEGRVFVDGISQKLGHFVVSKGQTITFGEKSHFAKASVKENIRFYYKDQHVAVVEKPAGLLTVSTAFEKEKTLHTYLKNYYRPSPVYVVHRLDQETSGVMLFALTEKAKDYFKDAFAKRLVGREYIAICEGWMEESSGKWESYLYEDENYVVKETQNKETGRLAVTHFDVIAKSKQYTALSLRLETGRKNQIRVHAMSSGHPLVGDKKYGAKSDRLKRLGLHAKTLTFSHPVTGQRMSFDSPLPESFERLIQSML